MNKELKRTILVLNILLINILVSIPGCKNSNEQKMENLLIGGSFSGIDGLGRELVHYPETRAIREDRFVGIFYFTWHGAHGYDKFQGITESEGIQPKTPEDTVSPYNITELVRENPENPQFGPPFSFHHWDQSYFGYYLSDDEWVIRKHAQMLSDAGIDVIILDITNTHIYLPQVLTIAKIFQQMRQEGISTPGISFLANTEHVTTITSLYNKFYQPELYHDVWFKWKGKPLLLCNPEGLSQEIRDFFTIRHSWAWSNPNGWFKDGKDKWPWLDHYPQQFGWHESKDKPEQISVCVAQHPTRNIGRSFHNGKQPSPDSIQPAYGLCFAEQWERALEVDPEFVLITGWNEWVAMRLTNLNTPSYMGKPVIEGQSIFVDLYNAEFSRDIEPARNELRDHYYMQMVNYIRKYKGTRPNKVISDAKRIRIDGNFRDWSKVESVYYDDRGDIWNRQHPGWGRIDKYENITGRNDILETRVALSDSNLMFYLKIAGSFDSNKIPDKLYLIIRTHNKQNIGSWEGYHFIVNRKSAKNSETLYLEESTGGWNWVQSGFVKYALLNNELELRISLKALKLDEESGIVDFKWTDNINLQEDILHCYDEGDAAPNGRFLYRFRYTKDK